MSATVVKSYGEASHDDVAFPAALGPRFVTADGRDAFDAVSRDVSYRVMHHAKTLYRHFQVVRKHEGMPLKEGEIIVLEFAAETQWASEWVDVSSGIVGSHFADEAMAAQEAKRLAIELNRKRAPLYAADYEGPEVGVSRSFDD